MVSRSDGVADERARGRFRTFAKGPYSFSFVFGSCAKTGSVSPVFDQIRRIDPHFFLHLGDFHYLDIGVNDRDAFRNGYSRVLQSRTQAALYRAVPIVYMWDDHDYGPNNSDKFAPGREASRAVYRECVPHYPLHDAGAIYQAFDIGRVRVILTDTVSERDSRPGATRTMLGDKQMEWFLEELTEAARTKMLVVWANPDPWIGQTNRSSHGWAPVLRRSPGHCPAHRAGRPRESSAGGVGRRAHAGHGRRIALQLRDRRMRLRTRLEGLPGLPGRGVRSQGFDQGRSVLDLAGPGPWALRPGRGHRHRRRHDLGDS